jgi:hypothetical protein
MNKAKQRKKRCTGATPLFAAMAVLLLFTVETVAIQIVVTGSWTRTIDAADLQGLAGSDLNPFYESATNQIGIDIRQTQTNWRVDIKKVDTNWHGNFHLFVRRTSNGNGSGNISGGTTYQEVTDADLAFFSGSLTRNFIDVQLRLEGVSVQVPQDSYATTVYYTVTEI